MIKVLFLASNPRSTSPLKLDEEIRGITQKIRASDYRDDLQLISCWAVTPDDLLQALNEHRPHVVHFSGHGSSQGEIILTGPADRQQPIPPEALRRLFATLKDNVRLVVLNACFSEIQGRAIMQEIDCVVAMRFPIGDAAAVTFAGSFYRALGFGRSLQEAFDQGLAAVGMYALSETETPQLLSRPGIEPAEIYLLREPATPAGLGHQEELQSRRRLVEALLACGSMRDPAIRSAIVDELPDPICSTIKRHPADLVDVANIFNRCLSFSGGLAALVEQLKFYEGNSLPMQRVEALLDDYAQAAG